MTAPSTPDLVSRILEKIDETERIARAAVNSMDPRGWTTVQSRHPASQYVGRVDPHATLLRCAADRKTLELHRVEEPGQDQLRGFCVHCGWRSPCPDVRNLAEALGIITEETDRG